MICDWCEKLVSLNDIYYVRKTWTHEIECVCEECISLSKKELKGGKMNKTRKKLVLKFALEDAAKAWCTKETEHMVMRPELAKAFAEILAESYTHARLGNATTGELLEEIKARVKMSGGLGYRTVDE